MRFTARLLVAGPIVALLCACGGGRGSHPAEAPVATYYGGVQALLAERCVGCHQPDGIAPFSLADAETAVELADLIVEVTQSRYMPPFPADATQCRSIRDSRALEQDELDLLQRWAQDGAPLGDMTGTEPAPTPVYGELDHVDATLRSSEPYTPQMGVDDHRCFSVDPGLTADAYLTAYAVREDAPGIIHHVQLWAVDDPAMDAMVQTLDDADSGPGYACPFGHGVDARYVSVWAPTDPVRRHPAGTGILLQAGRKMIVQIHYHADGPATPDQSGVELQLEPEVDHPASMWVVSNGEIDLPPGAPSTHVIATQAAAQSAKLWGVRAHMHRLGRAAHVTAMTGDGDECLLEIPRWDPNWQLMYFYEEPLSVSAGDVLQVDCDYDTRSASAPVKYGIGVDDEMCFGFFYVTEP